MKTVTMPLSAALAGALTLMPLAAHAEVISNAELSATTCFMCHGPEGKYSGGAIPPLAGYPANVMVQQLKDMKSGKRPSTVMQRHLMAYSDEEIEALASYFATLKP